MDDNNDYSNEEYEEEEHEYSVNVNGTCPVPVKLVVRTNKSSPKDPDSYLHTSSIQCSYSGSCIGEANGTYVRRVRPEFLDFMDGASQELSAVGWDIFDRYGYLKRESKNIIFDVAREHLEHLLVDKKWRKKGLGRAIVSFLVQRVLAWACPQLKLVCEPGSLPQFSHIRPETPAFSIPHVFAGPGLLNSDIRREMEGKPPGKERELRCRALESANAFYRSLGFRRIGMTSVFGFSLDPGHSSHNVAAAQDCGTKYQPNESHGSKWVDMVAMPEEEHSLPKEKFPLHHAALHSSDAQCVEAFEQNAAEGWVKWNICNNAHENILHFTAWKYKPLSTKWLLNNVEKEHLLTNRPTHFEDGVHTMDASDSFQGFSPEAVECLIALRRISDLKRIQRLGLKYGCTCGRCIGGFISPRMSAILGFYAKAINKMLNICVDDGTRWLWIAKNNRVLRYVTYLQQDFRAKQSFRQAFADIFGHIYTCLRKDIVPGRNGILTSATDKWNQWLLDEENGVQIVWSSGKIEPALETVIHYAAEQDKKAGNGIFDEIAGEKIAKVGCLQGRS
ncbi:hypothetical protein BDZ45DRAFT_722047 [Acephala macrosclerotiorum]|nr:hypothetical protein BDZ45DRAFT_722047 [Acephala macrosclerotiorum]